MHICTYIHTHVLKQLLHSQKEYYIPTASCYLDNSSFPLNWVEQIYNTSSSLHEFIQPLLRNSVSLDEDSSEHCPFICWGQRSLVEWVGLSTLAGSLRRAHLSHSRTRIMVAAWWMDSSLVSNTLMRNLKDSISSFPPIGDRAERHKPLLSPHTVLQRYMSLNANDPV